MSPSISSGYDVENERTETVSEEDSEYGSMLPSAILPDVIFTPAHLNFLNQQLSRLEPEDIIRWCLISLPGLFQTTALGLTGAFPNTSEQY
jgi:phosphoadenosine phosphosulfate reductase